MNAKSLLAVLAGAVVHFLLGFLIYGLMLSGYMEANTLVYEGLMKEGSQPMIGYAFSSLLFAMLLTYVLNRTQATSRLSSLVTAGTVTLLMALSIDLMYYFGMNLFSGMAIVVDVIAFTVMGSLTGWVIGLVLNRKKASQTSTETSMA